MQESAPKKGPGGLFWSGMGLLAGLLIWRLAGPALTACRTHAAPPAGKFSRGSPAPAGLPFGDLPGVDLAGLSDRQKFTLLHRAAAERCTCGCKESIARCRHGDEDCKTGLRLARELYSAVAHQGAPTSSSSSPRAHNSPPPPSSPPP